MNKKEIKKIFDEKLNDLPGLSSTLFSGSDYECAIVGGSLLEEFARIVLENIFIDKPFTKNLFDGGGNQPLSTFGQRITFLLILQIINEAEYKELKAIKSIRNNFAHHLHGLTFEDKINSQYINTLNQARNLLYRSYEDVFDSFSARHKFAFSVIFYQNKFQFIKGKVKYFRDNQFSDELKKIQDDLGFIKRNF